MLALLMALAIYNASNAPSPCKVVAQPKLSIAPLRAVQVKVTIDPRPGDAMWRQAQLCIVDEVSQIRCSMLFEGDSAAKAPRTQWVNWLMPNLAPGVYKAIVVVQSLTDRCMASDTVQVHGEQP
jgi:hypothetical protein